MQILRTYRYHSSGVMMRLTGSLALVMIAASCARRAAPREPLPTDGLRFFATAQLTGAASDSLLVRVTARNVGGTRRALSSGICGDPLVIRAYRRAKSPPRSGPAWDSELWRQATNPAGYVCLPTAILQFVPAGDSADVAALALPVRAVLGDSLPAARYRVTARLNSTGERADEIDGGTIELRVSPP